MPERTNQNFFKQGFTFFIASLLFATYYIFLYLVPTPPFETSQLFTWITEWKIYIQIADEILIFATLSLLPCIYTLINPLKENHSPSALFASALFFLLLVPMLVLVDLLLGRLVYPVNNYPMSVDTIVFTLSLITGTMHMISLVLALAILLYGFSFRKKPWGGLFFLLGIYGFVFQIIASYPWLISPGVLLFCQLSFPIWLFSFGFYFLMNENKLPKKNQTDLS